MGFISNVLEYGFTTGSIIATAEREADRICKNIKTTVIEEDGESKMEENTESDEDPYGFQIIFHPECLPEEERVRREKMQQS